MGLSLKELKEYLITKGGYTITPNHSQLADLKTLVYDMVNIRSGTPPSTGSGDYSGTTCNGHTVISDYNLSLGDISALDIKGCSCHTVKDTTAYCRSRTYTCSCNSNVPVCTCDNRIAPSSCDCQDRTYTCSCNSNTPTCTCDSRETVMCLCQARWQTETVRGCECNVRTFTYCDCQNRTSSCGSRSTTSCTCNGRTPEPCNCENRTSSCGSRNTVSCTCNGRCACNSEKRFQ